MEYPFIKEVWTNNGASRAIVRSNSYSSTLSHIVTLFDALQADFQQVDFTDVDVVRYAGISYAHTYGLECALPEGTAIPAEYRSVSNTELRY